MQNTNKISGLDNIVATGAILTFVLVLANLINVLFVTSKTLFSKTTSSLGTAYSTELYRYGYSAYESVSTRFSLTLIILCIPILILLMRYMHKTYQKDVARWNSPLQRVYIHGMLYVSVLAALSVVITFLYDAIGGEFSLQNGINGTGALALVASMFYYGWYRIKTSESIPDSFTTVSRNILVYVLMLTLGIIGGHIYVNGSPQSQLKKEMDTRRVSDLSAIQEAILYDYSSAAKLPKDLNSIYSFYGSITDPVTYEKYEYTISPEDQRTFELCATFATSVTSKTPAATGVESSYWDHATGKQCFKKTIEVSDYSSSGAYNNNYSSGYDY